MAWKLEGPNKGKATPGLVMLEAKIIKRGARVTGQTDVNTKPGGVPVVKHVNKALQGTGIGLKKKTNQMNSERVVAKRK